MKVVNSHTRPHFDENCWCSPRTCECCGGVAHRVVDLTPDFDQTHMGAYSDQRI